MGGGRGSKPATGDGSGHSSRCAVGSWRRGLGLAYSSVDGLGWRCCIFLSVEEDIPGHCVNCLASATIEKVVGL